MFLQPHRKRRMVDFRGAMVRHIFNRVYERDARDSIGLQPHVKYSNETDMPRSYADRPIVSCTTRLAGTVVNKVTRAPVNALVWTPECRGTLCGSIARFVIVGLGGNKFGGHFCVWNTQTWMRETVMEAHNSAIRAMTWTHDQEALVSADNLGNIKIFNRSLQPVCNVPAQGVAHSSAARDLSFAPGDKKFVSAGDDMAVKIWNFGTSIVKPDVEFSGRDGHDLEVKCAQWHPQMSLIASGGKDNTVRLWDPRTRKRVRKINAHTRTVMKTLWNEINGNWLLTASHDGIAKVYDVRKLGDDAMWSYMHGRTRLTCKKLSCAAWHPIHEDMFTTADEMGSIYFWRASQAEKAQEHLKHAHRPTVINNSAPIWAMAWDPSGSMLCTGCNDTYTKFWTRQKVGATESSFALHSRSRLPEDESPFAMSTARDVASKKKDEDEDAIGIPTEERSQTIPGVGVAKSPGLLELYKTKSLDLDNRKNRGDTSALGRRRVAPVNLSEAAKTMRMASSIPTCSNCGMLGHTAKDCAMPVASAIAAASGETVCPICMQTGHPKTMCPKIMALVSASTVSSTMIGGGTSTMPTSVPVSAMRTGARSSGGFAAPLAPPPPPPPPPKEELKAAAPVVSNLRRDPRRRRREGK